MSTSGNPVTYPVLKAIIPYLTADTRIQVSRKIPDISKSKYFSKLPLNIDYMSIGPGEVVIENTTFKFNPLVSLFFNRKSDIVQFTINDEPAELLKANSSDAVMNAFLEKVFNPMRPSKIRTLELRTDVTAKIQLTVENVKIGSTDADFSKITSSSCLPLKSLECMDWDFGFSIEDSDQLIIPDTVFPDIVTFPISRIHARTLTPGSDFLMHLLNAWVVDRSLRSNNWSFEITSREIFIDFMNTIEFCEGLDIKIEKGEHHVTCQVIPGETLKISCLAEQTGYHLHMKFEK